MKFENSLLILEEGDKVIVSDRVKDPLTQAAVPAGEAEWQKPPGPSFASVLIKDKVYSIMPGDFDLPESVKGELGLMGILPLNLSESKVALLRQGEITGLGLNKLQERLFKELLQIQMYVRENKDADHSEIFEEMGQKGYELFWTLRDDGREPKFTEQMLKNRKHPPDTPEFYKNLAAVDDLLAGI